MILGATSSEFRDQTLEMKLENPESNPIHGTWIVNRELLNQVLEKGVNNIDPVVNQRFESSRRYTEYPIERA